MDEDQKNLLASLTETRLPALPESREPAEPRDPSESTGLEVRGRTPEEVLGERTERTETPAEQPAEEVTVPAKKGKAKAEAKTYEIDGKRYTAAELEAAGLLESVLQQARQFKPLQKKYFELDQQVKAAPPAAQPQAPQPAPLTNDRIAQVYDPFAEQALPELVKAKLLDEDLVEAWPRSVKTLIGQLRFAFDVLFELKADHEQVVKYLHSTKKEREDQITATRYNNHLDSLVALDPKLYGGLKDRKVRDTFTKYLVEEVNANLEQTTGEKAPAFLAKQWVAFKSDVILDAAKTETADKKKRQDKRFVSGELGGVRPGAMDNGADKPMLDRMIDNSGKIQ